MALLFDGTNDSLQATVDLSSYNKITVAFWLYWDSYADDNDMCMEFTADEGATVGSFGFFPNHASSTWLIGMFGDAGNDVATFTRPSAAAWHQFTILLDRSASSHEIVDVYVDGTAATLTYSADLNNSDNFANSTLNFMSRNNTTFFGAGRMAEVAIWPGIILTAGEAKALARFAPPLIRPTTKPFYWPMIGRDATVIERGYGAHATINGAVQTDHPPVIYPSRAYIKADTATPPPVVPGEFASGWAHSWVNPSGVAHPKDISDRQHMTLAIPPFDLLGSNNPLAWLGSSATMPVKAPDWPYHHLNTTSVGPPFLVESPGWFPVGGQLAQRPPTYPPPEITGLAFITPTDYAVFPHVPPWLLPLQVITKPFDYVRTRALIERVQPIGAFVSPPAATTVCSLTLGDLKTKVYEQLDDDGTYYTGNEVRHALNVAQNTFALLTLCVERTANFTPLAETCFYVISTQLSDFLVPLRVTCGGSRIRPATFHQLDGSSSTWRNTATGTPTRYVVAGYDLIAFTPQFIDDVIVIRITYAAMPTQLSLDTDIPEIPSEQQIHLVDYACWWLRLKEGGQELANASDWLKRFVEAARKYGDFVRRRSYGQKYDTAPFDLSSFDMGRLDIKLKR